MSKEFNENPFLKDTPVVPFSNSTEAMVYLEMNCDLCVKRKECELKEKIEDGFMEGSIPLWVAKEIGCSYNPLYGSVKLMNQCHKFSDGTEPF